MRLNRLDLTYYGKFTGHPIDFDAPEAGAPDLHIVYGPNEAGKSTAFSAFLDILFGIEMRSAYGFKHAYNTMEIGASLTFGDRSKHNLVRVKRNRNDLLDANRNPIPEALIAGELGGIDRESYRAMFSLDDDTIESGGEDILASNGDLGQLLFSASTGLAKLSGTLAELRAEADGFHKLHARNSALSVLKARLDDLKKQQDGIDTVASQYARLVAARDRSQAEYEEASTERARTRARLEEIQRLIGAMPRLRALRTARTELDALDDLPNPPADWADALPTLRDEATSLTVRFDVAEADIAEKAADLEASTIDEAALAEGEKIDRLMNEPHARHLTAERDIPPRTLEVREADLRIAGILARIGREGDDRPERFVLEAAAVGTFRALMEERSGVEKDARKAEQELETARRDLTEAEAGLQSDDTHPADDAAMAALRAQTAARKKDDHAARARLAARAREEALARLADQLPALHPWRGDIEQLAAQPIPDPTTFAGWKAARAAAETELVRHKDEPNRLENEHRRLFAERDALARIAGAAGTPDSANARAVREASWAAHRRALDAETADAFEAALRHDDLVTDARFRHEAEIAKLNEIDLDLSRVALEARLAVERYESAVAAAQRMDNAIDAALAPILPAGTTPEQAEAWIAKRDRALATRADLQRAERDLREAERDADDARRGLTAALRQAGVPHDADAPADALLAAAEAALDREKTSRDARRAVEKARRDTKRREQDMAEATTREAAWRTAWRDACAGCWVGMDGAVPSLPAMREILAALADLGSVLEKRAALRDRIDAMRNDQRAFAETAAAHARELAIEANGLSPLDLAARLKERVGRARTAAAARAEKTDALHQAREALRTSREARTIHDRRVAEMTSFFGVASLTEVAVKLDAAARKNRARKEADEAVRDILDALGLPSIVESEQTLDTADRSALDTEAADLKARFEDQDQRAQEFYAEKEGAAKQVAAIGGDDAVARLEEQRRTTLLEVEDGALRYLKLRLGVAAAEHALRTYRQRHRGAMLTQASDAFRIVSRGAYSGLASQPDRDTETMIAVAADGTSKLASQLSKGTRFQLYLALRLAGYREFARLRPPLPFVADDIMETFDEERTEEALRLLADMATTGQVIYLTHHRFVRDMARRLFPGVGVHDLPASAG